METLQTAAPEPTELPQPQFSNFHGGGGGRESYPRAIREGRADLRQYREPTQHFPGRHGNSMTRVSGTSKSLSSDSLSTQYRHQRDAKRTSPLRLQDTEHAGLSSLNFIIPLSIMVRTAAAKHFISRGLIMPVESANDS